MNRESELPGGPSRRRLVEIALFAVLIAGAVAAMPGLGDLRERLSGADPVLIAVLAAVELGSCLAFVLAFRGVFSRRLSWRFSYEVAMSEQAANVLLPTGGAGGLALGAWALQRIGMPAERIGRRTVAFFLITSSINFVAVVVAGFGLATGVLPGEVALATALIPAAGATLLIGGLVLAPRLLDHDGSARGGRLRRAVVAGRGHLAAGIRDAVRAARLRAALGRPRGGRLHGARRGRPRGRLRRARRRGTRGRRLPARLHGRPARRPGPAPRRHRRHRRRPDRRLRPARDPDRDRRRPR